MTWLIKKVLLLSKMLKKVIKMVVMITVTTHGPHLIPHVIIVQLLAPTGQKVYITIPGVSHGKSSIHVSCIY